MSTRQKSLDQLLVERELFDSRSQAQAAIMAGLVGVGSGGDRRRGDHLQS